MPQSNIIGRKIMGYTVKEKLGSGAYGTVYKVEKENAAGEFVRALKHISFPTERQYRSRLNSMGGDAEKTDAYFRNFQDQILTEVKILNKLSEGNIPNVVRYHDCDIRCDGTPKHYDIFILMEYLTPLEEYIQNGSFTVQDTIQMGEDILKGLSVCHKAGIIHRDIKDDNIFVYKNPINNTVEYKIGDFGISRELCGLSKLKSAKGTPEFVAPEVFAGKKGYTQSVDLYSLGIVLYRMLNHSRAPFLPKYPEQYFDEDEEDAFQRRMEGEIPDPPSIGGEALGKVIVHAISDEANRFSDADEFLTELKEAASNTDAAILQTVVQDKGVICHHPTKKNETISGETIENDQNYSGDSKNVVTPVFPEDHAHDLSFYGALNIRDYELKKDRKWQVSTPEGITTIQLPENVRNGQMIPYPGKGRMDPNIGERGTLYVKVTIEETTVWMRHKGLLIAVGCSVAAMVILGIMAFASRSGEVTPETRNPTETSQTVETVESVEIDYSWSEWTDRLPDSISEEDYEIENQTLYSSRTLEKTSSAKNSMPGWELYDTKTVDDGYGEWSGWSSDYISESEDREVEEKTWYRYRDEETTTSSSSNKSGWELYDTTWDQWGDYGSWSGWTDSYISSSNSCDVESKNQYRTRSISYREEYTPWSEWGGWSFDRQSTGDTCEEDERTVWGYYYFLCPNCGAHMHGWGECYKWAGGCGAVTKLEHGQQIWSPIPWNQAGLKDWHGTGKLYTYLNGELVFKWDNGDGDPRSQYRYRTRSTQQVKEYGDWQGWTDGDGYGYSSEEVETRTLYRYREREMLPTYHYCRWSGWSDWQPDYVSGNDSRQVETDTYYRYRDQLTSDTYYFQRWTDWTDYSDQRIEANDEREVQTQTLYRYRKKPIKGE